MSQSTSSVFSYESAFSYDINEETFTEKEAYASSNKYKSAFGYTYQLVSAKEKIDGESWPSKFSRTAIITFSYIIVFLFFPFSLCICVKKVHALERLVVLRLGKLQPVLGPGYCVVLPFIDKCSVVDLRPKTFTVPSQQILTVDGAVIEILASIKYCVCHAVHYVTKLHEQEQSVHNLMAHCFTNFVSEKEQTELEKQQDLILSTIKMELNRTMVNWGLEIIDVTLGSMKVIKEAEPVNSLDHVFGILKNLASNPDFSCFDMPVPPNSSQKSGTAEDFAESLANEVDKVPDYSSSILTQVSNLLEVANKRNAFINVIGTFKFIILGRKQTILFISLNKGITNVEVDDNDNFATSDVTVTLTMEDMQDFLNLKISPIHAYVAGKFKVDGNQQLLQHLANVFE